MKGKLFIFMIFGLTVSMATAWVCADWGYWQWLWTNHNGTLPNMHTTHTQDSRTWSVTANFGGGNYTVSGDAWCGDSNTNPPTSYSYTGKRCWCRITSPVTGTWIMSRDWDDGYPHALRCGACEYDCAKCVYDGQYFLCDRPTILN